MLDHDTTSPADDIVADYNPVPLEPRHNGWTAARQRTFLVALAETGSISLACTEAGISARSAYRLRARPEATAFADAWEQALKLATLRLVTIAFERATRGAVREHWKNGELIAETRTPSDRMLTFIFNKLLSSGAADMLARPNARVTDQAITAFPQTLARLVDSDAPLVPIEYRDFYAQPPEHPADLSGAPGDAQEDW